MKPLIAALITAAMLAFAPSAYAAFGDDYGIAPINDGAGPLEEVPAMPGSHAFWAGTCDRGAASGVFGPLGGGGFGSRPTEIFTGSGGDSPFQTFLAAPETPDHCIDWGALTLYTAQPSEYGIWQNIPWEGFTPGGGQATPVGDYAPSWRLAPVTGAGTHPDGTTMFAWNRNPEPLAPGLAPNMVDGSVDNIHVDLPPGFVANPQAVPECTAEQFRSIPLICPPASQVGVVRLYIEGVAFGGSNLGQGYDTTYPLYNVEPRKGRAAELGFGYASGENAVTVRLTGKVRTNSDYGVSAFTGQIPSALVPIVQSATLWGVPWAAENDIWRPGLGVSPGDGHPCVRQPGGPGKNYIPPGGLQILDDRDCRTPYDPSWGEIKPFITTETDCNPSPTVRLATDSFQAPGAWTAEGDPDLPDHPGLPGAGSNWKTYTSVSPPVDGCGDLDLDPTISLDPVGQGGAAVRSSDSPAGLDVELRIPQNNEPPAGVAHDPGVAGDPAAGAPGFWRSDDGRATAHLKDTVVTLPAGMTLNPSAADGQGACTMAQVGVTDTDSQAPPRIRFNNQPVTCPDSSKVAQVVVETPLLAEADWPRGDVYLAAQGDNPFGSDFAIYIALSSPERGLRIKLAGEVHADPQTGRLTTTFADNPELPFDTFRLRFKAGPRAPLATPVVCGSHDSVNRFTSHARPGAAVVRHDSIPIDSSPAGGCPTSEAARPFTIGLKAGSAQVGAGQYSAFHARFTRGDGQQEFDRIELSTPEGLSGKLAGVPYCPEAGIARAVGRTATGDGALERRDPSCPAASKVGTTTVGAGAGPNPFYVSGDVYLAGPYKGAPLSMVFIVPAVAGPFDLGVQVVRAQLQVDPFTAQITTVSDEIPKILRGVPLRVRDIRVDISRPEFTLNPTDCSEQQVTGQVFGASGAVSAVSNRFQVDGCHDLGFKPRFRAKILDKGRRSTLRSWNPRTRFVVAPRPGDANIGGARVALPSSTILDQSNLDTTCTRARMAAEDCPAGSIVGYATAWSPLLDQPVQGPVYLAANGGVRPLPDLMAVLDGQIRVSLLGEVSTLRTGGKARLQNTFRVVPDAPVSRFVLTMRGGKNRGLLVNSTDLCRSRERGVAVFHAQNGRVDRQRLRIGMAFKGCRRVLKQQARRKAARKRAARKKAARKRGARRTATRSIAASSQAHWLEVTR